MARKCDVTRATRYVTWYTDTRIETKTFLLMKLRLCYLVILCKIEKENVFVHGTFSISRLGKKVFEFSTVFQTNTPSVFKQRVCGFLVFDSPGDFLGSLRSRFLNFGFVFSKNFFRNFWKNFF